MTDSHRLAASRTRTARIEFDRRVIDAFEGETVATALLAAGTTAFTITRDGDPRVPMCNMGACFDCVVTVDGQPWTRACLTPVRDGMVLTSTRGV